MEFTEAVEKALNGNAVAFTGAGFSSGAKNFLDTEIADGRSLAGLLFERSGKPGYKGDLDLAATFFLRHRDPSELVTLLRDQYTVKSVTPSHVVLGNVPWRRVYTTNYDLVMETGYGKNNRRATWATLETDVRDASGKANVVVHINGCIDLLTQASLRNEFKLTNQSYLTTTFLQSPWCFQFRSDLRLAQAIFFLGYSLYDLDIQRVLFEEEVKDKCFFIVRDDLSPDDPFAGMLAEFGTVIPIGINGFAARVESARQTFVPAKLEPLFTSFERVWLEDQPTLNAKDQDIIDLLTRGFVRRPLIWKSLIEQPPATPYYIRRPEHDKVTTAIESGKKTLLVTSSLGNGKTVLLEGVLCLLSSKRYACYRLAEEDTSTLAELEKLSVRTEPTVIVIENYHRYRDLVEFVLARRSKDVVLVLTERTEVHDTYQDTLQRWLGGQTLLDFNLDTLHSSDVQKLREMLDHFGLWGERSAHSADRKERFIRTDCGLELRQVLVHVLNSPVIRERYADLFRQAESDAVRKSLFIAVFTLQVLGFTPSLSVIRELLSKTNLSFATLRADPVVRQLVDVDSRTITARSSILAQFFLKHLHNARDVVDTLITMTKEAEELGAISHQYQEMYRALMAFSALQTVLPDTQKRPAIINYYESIKGVRSAERNPHFWLQYAIARLSFGEYAAAEQYFKTSYSLAHAMHGYNTYQIDNHYARLLLEQATSAADKLSGLEKFIEAKEIIQRQMLNENRYYPYRVARLYADFWEQFKDQLSEKEKRFVLGASEGVVRKIDRLPQELRRHRYVVACREALQRILDQSPPATA